MPLDHYVSQVHLKNFYSPALGNRLHAIRKSDLKQFSPRAEDVCRIDNGSTNAYLTSARIVEEFLRDIERRYNASVAKLRSDEIDREAIYALAGFAAYVSCCAPAAMRIHAAPLKNLVETTTLILDRRGAFNEKIPETMGGKSISELLAEDKIRFVIDHKYPQAIGIGTMIQRLSTLGNSPWEILHNTDPSNPFFTSDFPVAIEARGARGIVNRIMPLTPNLAARIIPNASLSREKPDLSFRKFRCRHRNLTCREIERVNRLIVRCAEDTVFYRDDHDWIAGLSRGIANTGSRR